MKLKALKVVGTLSGLLIMSSCDMIKRVEEKAAKINRYETVSLHLAKENDALKAKISELQYEIEVLKSKNNFLSLKLEKNTDRAPASLKPVSPQEDLVKYQVYRWSGAQLLATAEKEFEDKNFEKASQFFETFLQHHDKKENMNDKLLFSSGMAAYETGKHDDWAIKNLDRLIKEYPTSKYYRGAKLWKAMASLRMGDQKMFFETVEEFRKKYRNTSEWEILSAHYEKILQQYKN